MKDADELGRRIEQLAADPARDHVREYFDHQGHFAADTFETLGHNPKNEISNDDLLALPPWMSG